MYNDQILKLNNEQIENLDNLLSVLKNLQTAIVQNDLEKIESTIEQEEKVLNRIKLCEEKRFDTLKTLLNHYGIKAEKTEALDELAKVILTSDPEAYQEFSQMRSNLLEKVKEVLLINQQNEIIINNSRKFIRDLIKSVLGSRKENFFDRKI
ncbi:MAG: flagellar export chaperone FlgN [Ignavibacterium sp.]|jgi:cell division protein FtsX|nr:flagellar export chaperone FlgN [Ignavibacterium sp.]